MNGKTIQRIGFTCAYTPLAVVDAAGFTPYRVLPNGEWPDQAGRLLHDNLCPHIKRVLDRALDKDLPDLFGMIFINSCDAMRRLADAWKRIRPDDNVILLDLPATAEDIDVTFYAGEIARLWETLNQWQGKDIDAAIIWESVAKYNRLARILDNTRVNIRQHNIPGGSPRMQEIYNRASTEPADQVIADLQDLKSVDAKPSDEGIPVFVFGNMLSDPDVYDLFETSGVHVADSDFCTGSRLFNTVETDKPADVFQSLSRQILSHPPCARTFKPSSPAWIADDILSKAKACGAKGVIGHVMKFCDPYLARIPLIRKALQKEGLPMLVLEGDCTTRSIGQQKTRIEAFIEMLR